MWSSERPWTCPKSQESVNWLVFFCCCCLKCEKLLKFIKLKKNALIPLFCADNPLAKVQGHYMCTCNHQSVECCFYSPGFQTLLASWKAAEALKTENIFAYVSLKPFATVKIPSDPEG